MSEDTKTITALSTAPAPAAVSVISLAGKDAKKILTQIFTPARAGAEFAPGQIILGTISDGQKEIDHCLIACESENSFAINCHGNPLIAEQLGELLQSKNAELLSFAEFVQRTCSTDDLIAAEARARQIQSKTLAGAKLISKQTKMGLSQTAKWWLANLQVMDAEDINAGAKKILADSSAARFFIDSAKIVLAGQPNSGKSTLLNTLCGKEKAIVTDTAGTTRDWVSAEVKLRSITAEIFDTAGLDQILARKSDIDQLSQSRAKQLIENCDLVLVVSETNKTQTPCPEITGKNLLKVYNKTDLTPAPADSLGISAKQNAGIDKLISKIESQLGVVDFDFNSTICFNQRQTSLMQKISVESKKSALKNLIKELSRRCRG